MNAPITVSMALAISFLDIINILCSASTNETSSPLELPNEALDLDMPWAIPLRPSGVDLLLFGLIGGKPESNVRAVVILHVTP